MYAPSPGCARPGGRKSGGPVDFRLDFVTLSGEENTEPTMALTRRQREIYDFIRRFVDRKGYSPSLEEIGEHFQLSSVATVHKHVQHLVEKGFLRKAWNRSRSVEPLEPPQSELTIDVPRDLVPRRGDSFVLRVRGDSMIDEQIRDGDYVVVESRAEARDGETVVALVHGEEATLKRFYRHGKRVRLQPAAPLFLIAGFFRAEGLRYWSGSRGRSTSPALCAAAGPTCPKRRTERYSGRGWPSTATTIGSR
jgi:repressor LexA